MRLQKNILMHTEDARTEFKSRFSDEVVETLAAFANGSGGNVFIGIKDDGTSVADFSIGAETVVDWVNQVKNKTQPALVPDVEIIDMDGCRVVRMSITPYPVKPVAFRGRYYKRVANSNHQMRLNEISNMHLKTINLSWDFNVDTEHCIDDLSLEKVNQFIENVNQLREIPVTDDPMTVLRKFELLRDERVTIGCFLMFGREPTLLTTIDAGRFDSDIIIRDNKTIRDDLFAEVDVCMDFITKHISKRFVITGKPMRDEVWEYPLEAVREVVINMIVHRDYREAYDSTVKIFDDRIEFYNPGPLPDDLSLKDILSGRTPSRPRNKQIASIFKESGVIEKYGSGIRRVRRIMSESGAAEPIFESMSHHFKVILFPITAQTNTVKESLSGGVSYGVDYSTVCGGLSGGQNGGLNEDVGAVYDFIRAHPGLRSTQIRNALFLKQRTLERYLKKLKDKDMIHFDGPPKTGGYYPVSVLYDERS